MVLPKKHATAQGALWYLGHHLNAIMVIPRADFIHTVLSINQILHTWLEVCHQMKPSDDSRPSVR